MFLDVQGSLGMIKMDSKAQLTVDLVAKVAEGKLDIVHAAKLLNRSRRTAEPPNR